MSEYSRVQHLELVLEQLIHKHYESRELWCMYTVGADGGSLYELDEALWMQLYMLIPEVLDVR